MTLMTMWLRLLRICVCRPLLMRCKLFQEAQHTQNLLQQCQHCHELPVSTCKSQVQAVWPGLSQYLSELHSSSLCCAPFHLPNAS